MSYTWLLNDAPRTVPQNCWLFLSDIERVGHYPPAGGGRDAREVQHSLQSATIHGLDIVYEPQLLPTDPANSAALRPIASHIGSGSSFGQHTSIQRTLSAVSSWASVAHELDGDGPAAGPVSIQRDFSVLSSTVASMPPVTLSTPSSVTAALERESSASQELAVPFGVGQTQIDVSTSRSPRLGDSEQISSATGSFHLSPDPLVPISVQAQPVRGCDQLHHDRGNCGAAAVPQDSDVKMTTSSSSTQSALTVLAVPVGEDNNPSHVSPSLGLSVAGDASQHNTSSPRRQFPIAIDHATQGRDIDTGSATDCDRQSCQAPSGVNDMGFEPLRSATQPSLERASDPSHACPPYFVITSVSDPLAVPLRRFPPDPKQTVPSPGKALNSSLRRSTRLQVKQEARLRDLPQDKQGNIRSRTRVRRPKPKLNGRRNALQ
ncbi:hypothetical protein C8T65DRAFT_699036 [Cerioporus squamosus]|nr:hypothetical protein C8T65DRAFT_699036 [Cerioporus squamosus]